MECEPITRGGIVNRSHHGQRTDAISVGPWVNDELAGEIALQGLGFVSIELQNTSRLDFGSKFIEITFL